MKNKSSKLNLNGIKNQIVIGILIVLFIIVLGFIILNNTLKFLYKEKIDQQDKLAYFRENSLDTRNKVIHNLLYFNCENKTENNQCLDVLRNGDYLPGLCCYDGGINDNGLICIPLDEIDNADSISYVCNRYYQNQIDS